MKKIILASSVFVSLVLVFVIHTFPYQRLAGPLSSKVEELLRENLQENLDCRIEKLGFSFWSGFHTDRFECLDSQNNPRIQLLDLKVFALPFYQLITTSFRENSPGRLKLRTNTLISVPARVHLEFSQIPIEDLFPFALAAVPAGFRFYVQELSLNGVINGKANIPFKNFASANARLDLAVEELSIPAQNTLELLNLRPIKFDKFRILSQMDRGEINFEEVAVLSKDISGKVEGQFKIDEPLDQSQGQVFLKWKIGRGSSLRNSSVAAALVNGPCPSPDGQEFCTREINNLDDLEDLFPF